MRKKQLSAFLILTMIIQMVYPLQSAFAAGERNLLTLSPALVTITGSSFHAYDKTSGSEITDYSTIPQNAEIQISYSFDVNEAALPADDVKNGDYFSISLPSSLTNIATFDPVVNRPLTVVWSGDTYTIGYLNITAAGVATVTFSHDVETLSDVSTSFTIDGDFVEASIGNDLDTTFQLTASGATYSIAFEEDPEPAPDATIEKAGSYNPTTNEITWTISVDSGDSSTTITNVSVEDILGTNQVYKSCSLSADKISVNSSGNHVFSLGSVTGTTSFTVISTPTDGAFGNEGTTKTLSNESDLYANSFADPIDTATATVGVTTDWIQKKGVARKDGSTTYIDWTITLNNNNRTIPAGSTITDTIPTYLELDLSTVKRNTNLPSTFGDVTDLTGQDFTYSFNASGSDVTGIQTITFTTRVLDDYYTQQTKTSFSNTGILHIGSSTFSVNSSSVGVTTSLLAKTGKGYDAANQLITWQLEVNRNAKSITAATINDTLGANQVMYGDFGITRKDGSTTIILTKVTSASDVTSAVNQYYYDETNRKITIYLGDISTTDHPYITYKTQVTNPTDYANNKTTTYYNSSATLSGGGITDSKVTNASQSVASTVITKTSTAYNYTTRKISWTITVNQNKMSMPAAVVTDYIQTGQAYVSGSLKIDGNDPGYSLSIVGDTLTIDLGAITTQKVITFETEVTDLSVFLSTNGNVTFRNNASLVSGVTGAPTVSVWADRIVSNKALEKKLAVEYVAANGYIGWEVYINSNQVPMENAKLSDTLQDGLDLDSESVHLYYWNQDSSGVRTIGSEVSSSDYNFTYNYLTRLFELNLPNGAQGYYLRFNTDVLKAGQYSNSIGFSGTYNASSAAQSGFTVTNSDITVSGTGWNGSITVNKTDENGDPLAGAVFELLDSTKTVKATVTTDANGQAKFQKLKLRTYYVREKSAPLGYILDGTEYELTLTGDTTETRNQSVTVDNELLTASITLKKTDTEGNNLSGGEFAIYSASDTDFITPLKKASASDGIVKFENMLPGDYKIKELTAPIGYHLSDTVVDVSLTLNSTTNTLSDVTIADPLTNEPIIGSIILQKVNKDNVPLAGAQFGLFNSSGELIQTATSNSDGLVLFSDVAYGEYTIKELIAPDGYILSNKVISVNVTDSEVTKTNPYTFVDDPVVVIPQTGNPWEVTVPLTIGSIMLAAGLLLLTLHKYKKKKQ